MLPAMPAATTQRPQGSLKLYIGEGPGGTGQGGQPHLTAQGHIPTPPHTTGRLGSARRARGPHRAQFTALKKKKEGYRVDRRLRRNGPWAVRGATPRNCHRV